jgi:hypothetical protein
MVGHNKNFLYDTTEYWYRQRIVDRLHEIYSKNDNNSLLLPMIIENNDISIVKSAIILFGSWENAIREAGINYNQHNNSRDLVSDFWSPEKVLEHIQILYRSKFDLSANFIKHVYPELYFASTDKRIFSGWFNALFEAGVDYKYLHSESARFWTPSRIIRILFEYDHTYGNLQSDFIRKLNPSLYSGAHRYFKTWSEALEHSGRHLARNAVKVTLGQLRTYILKEYLKTIYDLLEVDYKINTIPDVDFGANQFDIPELQELPNYFLEIPGNGDPIYVITNYRSWGFDVEQTINNILPKYPRINIYYSIGEPRQWLTNNVKFINTNNFYNDLAALGRDETISDLGLLSRGGIPKAYQEQYDAIMNSIKKKLKEKKNHTT